MKEIVKISVVAFLLSGSLFVHAQSNDSTQMERKTPQERAQTQTAKMTKELALTADQSTKTLAINLDRIQKSDQLRAQKGDNRRQNFQAMRSIKQNYDSKMKAILTNDQFTKFQAMQAENRQKLKERRSNN